MDLRATPPTPIFPMYRSLVGVGLICGLLIVSVFQVTRPIIEKKRAEALERAIFRVLPAAKSSGAFSVTESGFAPADSKAKGPKIYAGFDESGDLAGLAIPAAGMGYADTIEVLYGYDPAKDAVVGMVVLASKETPGLGDKIAKDPTFSANFERLEVTLEGGAPKNPIVAVKHGKKTSPWQIDGITGATISSKAVANILRESTARWVPKIEAAQASFQPTAKEGSP